MPAAYRCSNYKRRLEKALISGWCLIGLTAQASSGYVITYVVLYFVVLVVKMILIRWGQKKDR